MSCKNGHPTCADRSDDSHHCPLPGDAIPAPTFDLHASQVRGCYLLEVVMPDGRAYFVKRWADGRLEDTRHGEDSPAIPLARDYFDRFDLSSQEDAA